MRVGRREVPFSNPDKVFFPGPGLTKRDLVRYYLDLAPCVLPHLRRRPLHMLRFPNGVEGDALRAARPRTTGRSSQVRGQTPDMSTCA